MKKLAHTFPYDNTATEMSVARVSFKDHLELLHLFLEHRNEIVQAIEVLLNCQNKPTAYEQDKILLSRLLTDAFYQLPGITTDQLQFRNQLEHAHWASGFKPRDNAGNELVNPAELMMRAMHMWRQTRWPGRNGRLACADTVFKVYLIRCLAWLCMRLWDDDMDNAGDRLHSLQRVLDRLWSNSAAGQPVLLKDVRWLIPIAISPTTDSLQGYFAVIRLIAETLDDEDQLAILQAWVVSGAGHLRAQLYHLCAQQNVTIDESGLVLITRKSNALDVALLVQGLVTLLRAYERALEKGNVEQRFELAHAICQGISADPQLFVNRIDLLGPYSMIEHLFITQTSDGQARYTAMGQRHLQLLEQYEALIKMLSKPLYEDCRNFRPVAGGYSPYGALYGFAANLLELIAFRSLLRDTDTCFSLEDTFTPGTAAKTSWVNSWRNLPHVKPEVVKQYEYPWTFVEAIQARVELALHDRVRDGEADKKGKCGRLIVQSGQHQLDESAAQVSELPLQYIVASDPQLIAGSKAIEMDEQDLLHCRLEGEFLVSYQTEAGWLGISKDLLTDILGEGGSAKITGLPMPAFQVLKLMLPERVSCLEVMPEN